MPLVEQYPNWVMLDPVLHYKPLADYFFADKDIWQSRPADSFFAECSWYKFPYCCHVPWYQNLNTPPTVGQSESEIYKLAAPIFNQANQQLGLGYVLWGAELNSVPPNCTIAPHNDKHFYSDYTTRIHAVLRTNSNVVFNFDSGSYHFAEGQCFIFNNKLRHAIQNNGSNDRLHLVMDFVPLEIFKYAERSITPFGGHGARHILANLDKGSVDYSTYIKMSGNQAYPFRTVEELSK
jgi:hypothetical protein